MYCPCCCVQLCSWLDANAGEVVLMRVTYDWAHREQWGVEQSQSALRTAALHLQQHVFDRQVCALSNYYHFTS